jgi:hypothetical protein
MKKDNFYFISKKQKEINNNKTNKHINISFYKGALLPLCTWSIVDSFMVGSYLQLKSFFINVKNIT